MAMSAAAREAVRLTVGRVSVTAAFATSFVLASSAVLLWISTPGVNVGFLAGVSLASALLAALCLTLSRQTQEGLGRPGRARRALALVEPRLAAVVLPLILAIGGSLLIAAALTS